MENGTKSGDKRTENNGTGDAIEECIVKMRGLPWSATVEDILSFLGKVLSNAFRQPKCLPSSLTPLNLLITRRRLQCKRR